MDENNENSGKKIFLKIAGLHPGTMFSSDLFKPDGKKFKEKLSPITLEDIRQLLKENITEIYYFQKKIEITEEDVSEVVQDIKQVNDFVIQYFYGSHYRFDLTLEGFENELKKRNIEFRLLTKLRKFSEETYKHSINVGLICLICGAYLNLKDEELEILSQSAFLHDIGKIFIPLEILTKPDKLSQKEFDIVKEHCYFSYQVLQRTKSIDKRVLKIMLQHHERFDGSGYPKGLTGDDIDFFAQLVGLAEIFDALTTERNYRGPKKNNYAIRFILNLSGIKFSQKAGISMTKALIKRFNIENVFEEKQLVLLNTNEIAEVVAENKNEPLMPMIEIKKMPNGSLPKRSLIVDLAFDNNREIVCVEDKETGISMEKLYQIKQATMMKFS